MHPVFSPHSCTRPRNADLKGALLWEPESGFQFQFAVSGSEQVVSPLWASLFVGVSQDGIAVLLSPACFTNPLQYGPDVGVLCGWAGRFEAEALPETPPSQLPAQSV